MREVIKSEHEMYTHALNIWYIWPRVRDKGAYSYIYTLYTVCDNEDIFILLDNNISATLLFRDQLI